MIVREEGSHLSCEDFGKKILVPVDGSATSNAAVERACEMAKLLNSQLTLIHVVTIPYTALAVEGAPIVIDYDVFDKAGAQVLENSKKIVEKNGLQASTILEHGVGNPSHEIVEVAREQGFSLIIMGARGHSVATHLLGSVSDGVLHNAPCCAMIVHLPKPK